LPLNLKLPQLELLSPLLELDQRTAPSKLPPDWLP
jgi:hypothetical protein